MSTRSGRSSTASAARTRTPCSHSACPGCVTRYQDAVLLGLLAQDEDVAARFVAGELGALVEDNDSARRVAATLTVFLEEGSSNVRAARRLGVHENTIVYRVKRAEALLGRPVDDRRLELRAALLLVDVLGRGAG